MATRKSDFRRKLLITLLQGSVIVAEPLQAEPVTECDIGRFTYPMGVNPADVAIADLNNDGTDDMVVSNHQSDNVYVLSGRGNGEFDVLGSYSVGNAPWGVGVCDLNRDRKLDLVVANAGSYTLAVLLGNGDGTFNDASFYEVGSSPQSVTVAAFNTDGIPDVVVPNPEAE